jgi:predicted flap endonuclease-1-like 5' DNA nuclease
MSLLFGVLFAAGCTSTHHKLALDALRHLRISQAPAWRRMFLRFHAAYLLGSTAPDDRFKDFKNHVLHVLEDNWGGAAEATRLWYDRTVEALRRHEWLDAVYAAGVVSHYFSDPLMPLHTAVSEEAGVVHRAAEWSIYRSYADFIAVLERDLGGYPEVEVPASEDWLTEMVIHAAERSNRQYRTVIDRFDIGRAVVDPRSGLDDELRRVLAELIGVAAVGCARILERAFAESGVTAPDVATTWQSFRAVCSLPAKWLVRRRANRREQAAVAKIHSELMRTGRVVNSLPEDERAVRALHAAEVLPVSVAALDEIAPRPTGTKHGQPSTPAKPSGAMMTESPAVAGPSQPATRAPLPAPNPHQTQVATPVALHGTHKKPPAPKSLKFFLQLASPIADAPSIGGKSADRLRSIGIHTVADLLAVSPEDGATRLALGRVKSDTVRDWQAQARLACRIPQIRARDAQILVACGITEPEQLLTMQADQVLDAVDLFLSTREGERLLREIDPPGLDAVQRWIESAQFARPLRMA